MVTPALDRLKRLRGIDLYRDRAAALPQHAQRDHGDDYDQDGDPTSGHPGILLKGSAPRSIFSHSFRESGTSRAQCVTRALYLYEDDRGK